MSRRPNSGKKTNLSQFGLLDIPDLGDNDDEPLDLSDDDFDLEAELAAISGGGQNRRPKKPPPKPVANLDAMIAESLKDVPSDDEGSGDDDDPDLLNELQALAIDDDEAPPPPPRTSRPAPPPPGAALSTDSSTISMLQDRITNYTVAEKNAKASGESGRARRFGRGLKTLNDLLKQAKAGKPVKNEDIPPPVAVGKPAGTPQADAPQPPPVETPTAPPEEPLIDFGPPEPTPPEPSLPEPSEPAPSAPETSQIDSSKREGLNIILARQNEFKAAALNAKKRGDKVMALQLLKVTKQFDQVVEAYNNGEQMDLRELPTVAMITGAVDAERKVDDNTQKSEPADEPVGLITATTLAEGLQQRLLAFRKQEAKAQEEGNSSKARRLNRIIKQYADAMKQHEGGHPIAVDELPAPAGYGPLPTSGGSEARSASPIPPSPSDGTPPPARASTRHDKQLAYLLKQQKKFKDAALFFKKKGDLDSARDALRTAKGFDPLIAASRAGQNVDLRQLPKPPTSVQNLEKMSANILPHDSGPSDDGASIGGASIGGTSVGGASIGGASSDGASIDTSADEDGISRLQQQLNTQIKLCKANMKHNRNMGNITEENKFGNLLRRVSEDLEVLSVAKLNNEKVKFHFEMRQFSVVQCNTDLNENDLELTIVRGIAYNVPNPKEVDTYVKFEFPFPQDAPPVTDRTALVKDTNSPEYNAVFPLVINRTRACLRVFKRHGIKLEVWSRGGWFRSDTLLGTVNVKLAPLQHQVTLHESFPLTDGRRAAGGSLEVKLRVRTPLVDQEIKTTQHRWLVIDA